MKNRLLQIMIALLCCLLLPVSEAHCGEGERFPNQKMHEIMRHVQPFLEEHNWLEPCAEHAILTWNDDLYIHVDFRELIAMAEEGILPHNVDCFHRNPDCVPGLTDEIRFMTIHFWGTDQAFQPCPICFPEGVKLLLSASETRNGKINLTIDRYGGFQDNQYDRSLIIVQLGAEDYTVDAISQYAGMSSSQSRHDPKPIYHPCYLAEPYQNVSYAERCPECCGNNFRLKYWEALDNDWIYCTNCGSIWNAEEGRTLAKH